MAERGTSVKVPARDNFKRGKLPKSVESQGDAYRHDKASAFGKIHGTKGSMGGKS